MRQCAPDLPDTSTTLTRQCDIISIPSGHGNTECDIVKNDPARSVRVFETADDRICAVILDQQPRHARFKIRRMVQLQSQIIQNQSASHCKSSSRGLGIQQVGVNNQNRSTDLLI